jgi:hypothetical protein
MGAKKAELEAEDQVEELPTTKRSGCCCCCRGRSRSSWSVWWRNLHPRWRFRIVLGSFFSIFVLSWIISTAVLLKDVYTELYVDPDTGSPRQDEQMEKMRHNPDEGYSSAAIMSAAIGYLLGPIMMLYGYQFNSLVVLSNALITVGVGDIVLSLQNVEELNKDISNGRVIPAQIVQMVEMALVTFTMVATALKIPIFNMALRAGTTANLVVSLVVHQIPPQYGCICAYGTIKCSPVYKIGMYSVENECFWDWWFRFGVTWTMIILMIWHALQHRPYIKRVNLAFVAANLMCQAIFDTVLAILPSYGSRVQPFRMGAMLIFASFAFKFHYWMMQVDAQIAGEDRHHHIDQEEVEDMKLVPCLTNVVRFVRLVGKSILWPLTLLNAFVDQLKMAGQHDMFREELKRLGFDEESKQNEVADRVRSRTGILQDRAIANASDANSKNLLRVLNLLVIPFALALLIGACRAATSDYAKFVDTDVFVCAITASVTVCIFAIAGFVGALTRHKGALVCYTAFVSCCLFVQIAVACLIFSVDSRIASTDFVGTGFFNASTHRDKLDGYAYHIIDKAKRQMVSIYSGSGCLARDADMPSPFPISCESHGWFESFVNNNCDYVNASNVADYEAMERDASVQQKWKLASFYYDKKQEAERTITSYTQCVQDNGATTGSVEGVYCACREAVNAKIVEHTEPLGHAVLMLCFVEMLCLFCASYIIHTTRRVASFDAKMTTLQEAEFVAATDLIDLDNGKAKGTTKKELLEAAATQKELLEKEGKKGKKGGKGPPRGLELTTRTMV